MSDGLYFCAPIYDNNIRFEGNVAIGQKFAQLFGELNIDWEEALSDVMGDIFAHRTANATRHAGNWLKEVLVTTQENITEYLQEELQVTPATIELENFYDDLADLRADSVRLLARFNNLEEQLINASKPPDNLS